MITLILDQPFNDRNKQKIILNTIYKFIESSNNHPLGLHIHVIMTL